jgi:pyruvate/2-oxoglutarate/acetoin dehydrogenase E1 component
MHLPGLVVAVPSRAWDNKGLIKTALRSDEPVIFLMHKRLTGLRGEVGGPDDYVPFGEARIVREGTDCTLVTYGGAVAATEQAAELLAGAGIATEVVDLRTLAPLDLDTLIASARKTSHVVVVDEAPKFAGPSAEIAAAIQEAAFEYLDAPVTRVAAIRSPIPEGPGQFERMLPTPGDIVEAVHATFALFGTEPVPAA